MRYPSPQNDFQIDRIHNGAICKEIGERLSIALGPQSIELQPRLLSLMKQLSEGDAGVGGTQVAPVTLLAWVIEL